MVGLNNTLVGVDPAADAMRAVATRGGRVVAAVEVPGSGVSLENAVRRTAQALERQGVSRGVPWCICPPPDSLLCSILELPPRSSGAPVQSLAAAEIAQGLGGTGVEVSVFELASRHADGRTGAAEYLVVGAQRTGVLSIVDAAAAIGITVEAADAPFAAISRVVQDEGRLIVELNADAIRLHYVHAGRPVFSRTSATGGVASRERLLVEEIDRCASYLAGIKRAAEIQGIVLAGVEASRLQYREAIEREFESSISVWSGECLADARTGAEPLGPSMALAAGLTLWRASKEVAA